MLLKLVDDRTKTKIILEYGKCYIRKRLERELVFEKIFRVAVSEDVTFEPRPDVMKELSECWERMSHAHIPKK